MNAEMFDRYITTQLMPALKKGDVVIFDNLSGHNSPDLNPTEMAFSKLMALLRKVAARTYDDLWQAAGHVCNLFTEEECANFFRAAGYGTDYNVSRLNGFEYSAGRARQRLRKQMRSPCQSNMI